MNESRLRLVAALAIVLLGLPALAQDFDGDGVPDATDNCQQHDNGPLAPDAGGNSQLDTNLDGYGNRCDPDLNNDELVGGPDFGPFTMAFGSMAGASNWNPDADFDGDGSVGGQDFSVYTTFYGDPPGPSGLACAGSSPCPDVSIDSPADEAILTTTTVDIQGTVQPPGTPVTINGLSATVTGSKSRSRL